MNQITAPAAGAAAGRVGKIGNPIATKTTFTFGVDSFEIANTRSLRKDTDFVSISLAVDNGAPMTKTKAMGDVDNGMHPVGLTFEGIALSPNSKVVFSYAIVNNGHSDNSKVESSLKSALSALTSKAASAIASDAGSAAGAALGASIGTAVVPMIGSALGALAGWLTSEIVGVIFANCDGPVAAGVRAFSGADLLAAAAHGSGRVERDHHPGVDSATGCGANSSYYVTWSVHPHTVPLQAINKA